MQAEAQLAAARLGLNTETWCEPNVEAVAWKSESPAQLSRDHDPATTRSLPQAILYRDRMVIRLDVQAFFIRN
jgi:hypothetical protein